MQNAYTDLQSATDFIQQRLPSTAKTAVILGSGLGGFAEQIEGVVEFNTASIPGYPVSTVSGHAGKWIFGSVSGTVIIAQQGRVHAYEGYDLRQVTFPVQLLANLGVRYLIITNAAGGLNRNFRPGDLMLITDHINLMLDNPLLGINNEDLGPRFPDMSEPYDSGLQRVAIESARDLSIPLQRGVLGALKGPTYETAAEVRMMQRLGADAGTMSTVPEVIAAVYRGVRVLGISCITNLGTGMTAERLSHDDVTEVADMVKSKFTRLISTIVTRIE